MKSVKILLSICIILALTSCKLFKKTSSEEEVHPLIGVWNYVEGTAGLLITTNSNQTMNDPFNSTGAIAVTGKYTIALDRLSMYYDEDPPDITVSNDSENGYYILYNVGSGSNIIWYFHIEMYKAPYQNQDFIGDVNYTFDGVTLVIIHSTLTDTTNNDTVTVSGTIAMDKVDLPANTPTLLEYEYIFGDFTQQWEFKDDDSFIATMTDDWGTYADTAEWNVSGNELTIIYTYDDGWSFTETFDYNIDGNTLNLSSDNDICDEGFETKEECFTYVETALNIDPGSLKAIVGHYEMTFNKAAAKQKLINKNVKPTKLRHSFRKHNRGMFDKLKIQN